MSEIQTTTYNVQASENGGKSWRNTVETGYRRFTAAQIVAQNLADREARQGGARIYRVVEMRMVMTAVHYSVPAQNPDGPRYTVVQRPDGFVVVDGLLGLAGTPIGSRYAANETAERLNNEAGLWDQIQDVV